MTDLRARSGFGVIMVWAFAALAAFLGFAEQPSSAQVIINEIDCDQIGTDAGEFVELYDGGVGNTALDGMVIVFYNGSNDLSYAAFDLDGKTTDGSGYFLLANTALVPVPGPTNMVFAGNTLQNGQDAVALYMDSASSFPTNTPVTDDNLIDAIVYDTADADDPVLLSTLLNPGEPQVNESAGGDPTVDSNQRCPNGAGGARNTFHYRQATPTPQAANNCPVDPLGACCLPGPICVIVTEDECTTLTGDYEGDDTECNNPNPCLQAMGACCDGMGGCAVTTQETCNSQMGTFKGEDTTCTPNPCVGACCDGMGNCTQETPADCAAAMGIYKGDAEPCTPNPCIGACCDMGGATCSIQTPADCATQEGGGVFRGDATTCEDVPDPCPPDFDGIYINEIRQEQAGPENDEFFEIVNTSASPKSLDGLSYLVIGDDGNTNNTKTNSGLVEAVIDLSGFTLPAGGHFLAADVTLDPLLFPGVVPDVVMDVPFNSFSDNTTHVLVSGFSGMVGDDIDMDDDCIIDNPLWIQLLDLVALIEEDNIPAQTECHYGTGLSFIDTLRDGPFAPGGVFRCGSTAGTPCIDGSHTGFDDWVVNEFDVTLGNDTPGDPNMRSVGGCCEGPAGCSDAEERLVCEEVLLGDWLGRGTVCAMPGPDARCLGACCECLDPPDCTMFDCTVTDRFSCENVPGIFQGAETECVDPIEPGSCEECLTLAQVRDPMFRPLASGVRICDVVVTSQFNLVNSVASKSFQIQDTSGTDGQTAISVFGTNEQLAQFGNLVGHQIDIQGTTQDFNGLFELTDGPAKALALSRDDGVVGVPATLVVTASQFQDVADAELFEAELVRIECVAFQESGVFEAETNYTVTDGTDTMDIRVSTLAQTDIIGEDIPQGVVSITGIVGQAGANYRIQPRTIADINMAPSCGPTGPCCGAGAECRDGLSESLCNGIGGVFRGGMGGDPDCMNLSEPCPDVDDVIITEIRNDEPGATPDANEYFELSGPPDTPLGSLSYIVIGDGAGGSGQIDEVVSLIGTKIPADGYYLVAENTYTLTDPETTVDLITGLNFENDDNVTHLLVEDFDSEAALAADDDLDTNDDGILDVTPWSRVLDKVALIRQPNPPETTEYAYGPPYVGPAGGDTPGHIALCPTIPPEWRIEAFDPLAGDDTPGMANPAVCSCAGCLGDMDPNLVLDGRDILPFVEAVLGMSGDGCADINLDASVDNDDVMPFATLLVNGETCGLGPAFGTRIMTWNLLNYSGGATSDHKNAYKQVVNHVLPDILVAQEVVGSVGANDFLNTILNGTGGPGGYAMAQFVDGPDSDNALYYRTDTITYTTGNIVTLATALRDITRWKVGHVGAGAEGDLFVYSAHLKADTGQANVDLRDAEATIMRNNANSLPAGTQFVYCGDFNFYNANTGGTMSFPNETAWDDLTGAGGDTDGQAFDPISATGFWHADITFSAIHTQSPHADNADAPPGASNGGLDDRFDFILISAGLQDGVDLSYRTNSYRAVGNDGNHFNVDINDSPLIPEGQVVADALHAASDHLPVILELELIAPP